MSNNSDIIITYPTTDENRTNDFHVIQIKSENTKKTWELYHPDFIEMLKTCQEEYKRLKMYAQVFSFFGKFSFLIISLASLLNSALAMYEQYKYVVIAITYFITFVGIMNTTFSFEKKAEDMYFISKEYENIGYKIKHILYSHDVNDKTPEEWYDIINQEMDMLDTIYFTSVNRVKKSIQDKKI